MVCTCGFSLFRRSYLSIIGACLRHLARTRPWEMCYVTSMRPSISAGVTLVALLAALVPGGLAPLFLYAGGSSCCTAGNCPMAAGQMSTPGGCHHAMGANASQGSSSCECRVSQAPGSAIPPTAFRFTFHLTAVLPVRPVPSIAVPLPGYALPLDQPPRL